MSLHGSNLAEGTLGGECTEPGDDCICPQESHCLHTSDAGLCPDRTIEIGYLPYCEDAVRILHPEAKNISQRLSHLTRGCVHSYGFSGGKNETICKKVDHHCRCSKVTNIALGDKLFAYSSGEDRLIGKIVKIITGKELNSSDTYLA